MTLLIAAKIRGSDHEVRQLLPLGLIIPSATAHAAIDNNGVLDDVALQFMTAASTWTGVITNYASWLFWLLGTISLVWTGGTLLLRQADIREFFAEFIRFIMTFGFFLWLLRNGPEFATSIIDSLRIIGAEAAGLPRELTPSEPISIALDIVAKSGNAYSFSSPFDSLAIFIITLLIVVCMTIVSANVLVALVSAGYFVMQESLSSALAAHAGLPISPLTISATSLAWR